MKARVLGPLRLRADAATPPLPSGRVRTLLEWLLLRPNEPHPTEVLVEHLWPGRVADDQATRRLRTVVSRLRTLLGGHKLPTPGALAVVTSREGYRLHADPEALDRLAFEEAADAALDRDDLDTIDHALAQWGGEPYTGFSLGPEVQVQRAHLDDLRRRLLEARLAASVEPPLDNQILSTKLRPPRASSPLTLTRSRLLDTAPRVGETAVVAVTAPAGYGKSTFLSQWSQRQSVPVAWVGLDASENDPVRLWAGILRAVTDAGPYPLDALDPELPRGSTPFLDALVAVIEKAAVPLVLVLDDLHVVSNQDVHAQIERLASVVPDGSTLAVASRTVPPLPVARWEAEGKVRAYTASDLAFDRTEIARLLEVDDGSTCGRAELIRDRTEGWPVAVGLLVQSGIDLTREEAGTDVMGRYLVDEVLTILPDDVATFIRETVHLRRFNRALCDAVTLRGNAGDMLAWLRRNELFVIEVESDTSWYRYHDLVADELRHHVSSHTCLDVVELDRRAARWCFTHGLESEALAYAVRSRDRGTVAETAGDVLVRAALGGEALTCRSWLTQLEPDDLATNPRAHGIAVYLAVLWLRKAERVRWISNRMRRFGDDDVVFTYVRAVEGVHEGRASEAVDLSERVLNDAWSFGEVVAPDLARILAGSALSNLVLARLLQDELRPDDDLLPNAVALIRPAAPRIAAWIHSYWALAAIVDGEETLARSLVAEFQAGLLTTGPEGDPPFGQGVAGALLASNQTTDPAVHRRLADGIEDAVGLHDRLGAYTQAAAARLVAACLYRRAGATDEAQRHEGRADVLMRSFVDAPFLDRLRDHLAPISRPPPHELSPPDLIATLTPRERAVVRHLASAAPMQDIATDLHISPNTLRSHVSSIYRKLGVHSRHEAIVRLTGLEL